jgi:hypothetical protein
MQGPFLVGMRLRSDLGAFFSWHEIRWPDARSMTRCKCSLFYSQISAFLQPNCTLLKATAVNDFGLFFFDHSLSLYGSMAGCRHCCGQYG